MIVTSGSFKGRKIIAPPKNITRPTLSKVRMSVFNILQSLVDFENSTFLDMYAGSGIMGLEALSRGFMKAVEIEQNNKVVPILKNNFSGIVKNKSLYKIYLGDSLKIVQTMNEKFDVIYIDPPYFSGIYEKSLDAIKRTANNIIILEHVTDVDFSSFDVLKQKKYGDKYLTVLTVSG